MLKAVFVGGVVGTLAAAALATTAVAAPGGKFDGTWSVVVVTEQGDCDRAYRYPIRIRNDGSLENAGSTSFDITGRVGGDGRLVVRLSYAGKSATGRGRLQGASGTGQWSGGSCSGIWTAERRS